MILSEKKLIDNYTGITDTGMICSEIKIDVVFWNYTRDGVACNREDADSITVHGSPVDLPISDKWANYKNTIKIKNDMERQFPFMGV